MTNAIPLTPSLGTIVQSWFVPPIAVPAFFAAMIAAYALYGAMMF